MDSLPMLAAVAAAFLLAGFVKGMIGMGLPTVAIGLLSLLMTPARAAAILVVPSLVTNVWQALAGGDALALMRRLAPLFAGICIGTFVGALWLPSGSGGQATVWLGAALVLYAALGLFKVHFKVPPRHETWLGLVMGCLTGALSVTTGIFVVPGVPFIQALDLDRHRLVQALGLSFTVSTLTLALALSHAGEMRLSLAGAALTALAAALIGMVLGQMLRGRVRPETFRLWFFLGLLALGVHLALHGLL
ncbi:MAG TPA: sulfite exporter TauE/SafE family protein [Pseudolabrys sp.]|nr:sulfite exporter TauE/SafE family protein [Pseudolabrys sp.]